MALRYVPVLGGYISKETEVSECWGTRERDECDCGGDKTKCTFYKEVRKKAEVNCGKSGIQIIAMDISTSEDNTCIISRCCSCNHILETKQYDHAIHGCEFTVFTECPCCGAKITKHIINE